MRKRMQKGDAQKQTNLKVWMQLKQQKKFQHLIWARISYFYVYTKKEKDLTSFSY